MQKLSGGLRETKKRATRRQLTTAGRRLALAHGLDVVTVEMICAVVGVSVRTFFNYFESKEASIAGEPMPIGDAESQQRFQEGGPTGDLVADLIALIDPTHTIEAQGRAEFILAFELFGREPRLLAQQLARGMAHEQELAGLIAQRRQLPEIDPATLTFAAIAQTVLRRGLTDWCAALDDQPLIFHIQRAADAAANLFTAPPTPSHRPRQLEQK